MRNYFTFLTLVFISTQVFAQELYFPPTGTTWETISPNELGWSEEKIEPFYDYLEGENSKAYPIF